jgi:DNA-binding transcriptional ArsR family regulator
VLKRSARQAALRRPVHLVHNCTVVSWGEHGRGHPPSAGRLVELIAQRFRVLSEPTRIKLLDLLRDGPATVAELTQASGSSQQNVSKHLGILHQASIVSRQKRGTSVQYAIADESVFELCEHVCGGLRRQLAELGSVLASA